VDGVLNHYHVGCWVVAGDAMAIKDAVTRELGGGRHGERLLE
jgi:hypothetical protein